jgi:hypothetical protein
MYLENFIRADECVHDHLIAQTTLVTAGSPHKHTTDRGVRGLDVSKNRSGPIKITFRSLVQKS